MKYSIDTSSILEAARRAYPRDVFPSLWAKIDEIADSGELVATQIVHLELSVKDDEVFQWIDAHGAMVIPLNDAVQRAAKDILSQFPGLVDPDATMPKADPFVIALAQVDGLTVVSNEKLSNSPKKPKIPNVCRALDVPCLTVLDMIRHEGWSI